MKRFIKSTLAMVIMSASGFVYADTDNFCENHPESSQCQGTGTPGPQGPQGPVGPQGPAGTDGVDGAKGDTGPAGVDGKNGTNGIDGAKGDTGPAGKDGKNGNDGAKGDTGEQGPKGDPGTLSPNQEQNLKSALNLNYKNIDDMNNDVDDAISMSAAIGSLPQAYNVGKTQLSGGFSLYEGNSAFAVGISRRFNEATVFKAGAATPSDGGDPVVSGSVGYEF